MQGKASEMKQGPSGPNDHSFEEKMCLHSGEELGCSKTWTDGDSARSQWVNPQAHHQHQGINEVPMDVIFLEPVTGKFISKVSSRVILSSSCNMMQDPPRTPSAEWLSKA
ncbi:hypothetical protein EI94DRAFT_1810526 [Lactarius quietus]|nr:hypothetical protein EI94DRAFT_1810526 [Lactarius quietus]